MKIENVAIIGSGPAGYTTAIYAARAGLNPVLYTGFVQGGQLTTTTEVDNFPGFAEGIQGPDLMEAMAAQAKRFDTRFLQHDVTELRREEQYFELTDQNGDTNAYKAVILATGATAKWLGVFGEQELLGRGVSSCATCDGFFYRNKEVAVVGGGDTAMEEATYLAKLCKQVYIIHRSDKFRASNTMLQRARNTENITFIEHAVVKQVLGVGGGKVTGIQLTWCLDKEPRDTNMNIDGVFVAIGHEPQSNLVKHLGVVAEDGYIDTEAGSTKTIVPGLFACGDVADRHFRQAITAAGMGCQAAIEAIRFLETS